MSRIFKKFTALLMVVTIITVILPYFSTSAETKRFMSDEEARTFLCFMYDKYLSADEMNKDHYYDMLTGRLENNVYDVKLAFLDTLENQLNNSIQQSQYKNNFILKDLQRFFEKELSGMKDIPEQELDSFINKQLDVIHEALIDGMTSAMAKVSGINVTQEVFDNLNLVKTSYSTVTGYIKKAETYIERAKAATEGILLPYNQERAGRYTYFSAYLDALHQGYSQDVIDVIMDYNLLAIMDNYPLGNIDWYLGKKDSWTEHTDDIKHFAEVVYEIENSLDDDAAEIIGSLTMPTANPSISPTAQPSSNPSNTSNPTATPANIASGTCGDNLTWVLDSAGTLTISGTGEMTNWRNSGDVPWHSHNSDIKNVIVNYGVTSIGDNAFDMYLGYNGGYSSNLTNVIIPNSVTSIGSYAFRGCSNLTSVTIPNSVTSIGLYAFSFCNSLTSINVDSQNKYYKSIDGVLFNYNTTSLLKYPNGKTQKSYIIPNNVTAIGEAAFAGYNNLTSITISNSVTSIEGEAFRGCSSLTNISIPNSVTSIDLFTFAGCSSLTSITIPSSVTSIGDSAFYDCSKLTDVYYSGTQEQWNNISIGSNNNPLKNATIHYEGTVIESTPTPVPTAKATATPTSAPTAKPTSAPTAKPTMTSTPTSTTKPMVTYTPIPTAKPIVIPTPSSTTKPTLTPGAKPTENPIETVIPSAVPTAKPSIIPTETPIETEKPSVTSTVTPSTIPTETVKPTTDPTKTPIKTENPIEPSEKPMETIKPSLEPTISPTPSETSKPDTTQTPELTDTVTVLGKYKGSIEVKKAAEGNKAVFTVSSVSDTNSLDGIILFVAQYDSTGKMTGVKIAHGTVSDNSLVIEADIPASDRYKFMLWDKYNSPIIKAVTEL